MAEMAKQQKDDETEKKLEDFQQELESKEENKTSEKEESSPNQATREALVNIKELMCTVSLMDVNLEALKTGIKERLEDIEAQKAIRLSLLQRGIALLEDFSKIKKERKLTYCRIVKMDPEMIKDERLKNLLKKIEESNQVFSKYQYNLNELTGILTQKIQQMEWLASLKAELQEQKLKHLVDFLEETQAQLDLKLSDPDVDQTVLRRSMEELVEHLELSIPTTEDLKHNIALIVKAHKDFLLHCKAASSWCAYPEAVETSFEPSLTPNE